MLKKKLIPKWVRPMLIEVVRKEERVESVLVICKYMDAYGTAGGPNGLFNYPCKNAFNCGVCKDYAVS
ncbi:MAG: hypothetical protein PHN59_06135 [Candidatus Omnitrophica bacterium]|nr:hypothetical protein [Candidatus Omnitrophota bacterium]